MDLMCRYENVSKDTIGISENVIENSGNSYIQKLIDDIKGNGEISYINFVKGISDKEIELVRNAFGDVYKDNAEGYIIVINDIITVYSETINGFIYAAAMIKRKCMSHFGRGIIYNYPLCETRGVKIFIPAEEEIPFVKEYAEFCAYYGINTIMMEIGGGMEYKKHPEINSGWQALCKDVTSYSGRCYELMTSREYFKNVFHPDVGGCSFVKQETVRELVSYIKNLGMNVIPEVPSLSHSDYLLYNHRELAERQDDLYPDTYCPSNPLSYKLLFDVIDEIIDVFQPEVMNIGHDEWFSIGICEKCKGKDATKLYAEDILKIYNYLSSKGINTMMWCDKLLNAYTQQGGAEGGALRPMIHYVTGKWSGEFIPSTYKARDLIPKDIKMIHWYWGMSNKLEDDLLDSGRCTIFGNFTPNCVVNLYKRVNNGINGVILSSWGAVDAIHIQRNSLFYETAFVGLMMWENHSDEELNSDAEFKKNSLRVITDINAYRNKNITSYVEVLHSLSEPVDHKFFGDGERMDFENDYIGKYIITYEDGEILEEPIYYGLNISYNFFNWERMTDVIDTSFKMKCGRGFEATYSCDYIIDGDKVFYKYRIPVKEGVAIESIEFKVRDSMRDKFYIKKVKIHN